MNKQAYERMVGLALHKEAFWGAVGKGLATGGRWLGKALAGVGTKGATKTVSSAAQAAKAVSPSAQKNVAKAMNLQEGLANLKSKLGDMAATKRWKGYDTAAQKAKLVDAFNSTAKPSAIRSRINSMGKGLQSWADNSSLIKSMEDGTFGKGLKTLGGDIYRYGRRTLANAPLIGKYMPAQNKHLGSFLHNMSNVTNDGMGRLMARRYGEHVGRAAAHVGRNRGKYIAGAMATPTVASWFGSDDE